MDLKNNTIKMSELIKTPGAREIIIKEFPELDSPAITAMAKNLTLATVLSLARGRTPDEKIDRALSELERL